MKDEEYEKINEEDLLKVVTDDALKMYIKSIRIYPTLSVEEQKELFRKGETEKLINCNLRLVVKIAFKYQAKAKHMKLLDLIQEGNLGLMRAIETYNPDEGAFTTYAIPWIRQRIRRSLNEKEKAIRIPVHLEEIMVKYKKVVESFSNKGLVPTEEEIKDILGISNETYKSLMIALNKTVVSINQKVGDEEDTELENFIPSEDNELEKFTNAFLDEELKKVLKQVLSPFEYYIIYYRILSNEKKTLEETAKPFNLTRERIRQKEEKTLDKIKPYLQGNSSKYYNALQKIKVRGPLDKFKTMPLSPYDIIKYFYLEPDLSLWERQIYELIFLDEFNYSVQEIADKLHLSWEEVKLTVASLTTKITQKFSNEDLFNEFKNKMIKTHGAKIFDAYLRRKEKQAQENAQKQAIDYQYLEEKYSNLTLEEIMVYFADINYDLNNQEIELLQKFFGMPDKSFVSTMEIEKAVNMAIFGYEHQVSDLPLKALYQTYLENINEFNDEQQLYLETYVFGIQAKKVFKETYPNAYISSTKNTLIEKLEKLYYHLDDFFFHNFTKEKWLEVKAKYGHKFNEQRTLILDLYFGVTDKVYSTKELMEQLHLSYAEIHNVIKNAVNLANRLYVGMSHALEIDKNVYLPYVKDLKYELSAETRKVLLDYLEKNRTYDEIVKTYGLTPNRVSSIVSNGLRRIDNYRYHIIEAVDISEDALDEVIAINKDNFSDKEIKVIYLYYKEFKTPAEISKLENIPVNKISIIISRFNYFYSVFKTRDVVLTNEDIAKEINYQESESVLTNDKKAIAAWYFGIKCSYNPSGKKASKEELMAEFNLQNNELRNTMLVAKRFLLERKAGMRKPELLFIPREDLRKILQDRHLPINEKERDIICQLFALNGYAYMNLEELALKYGGTVGYLKDRYQNAILKIYKYLNKEMEGTLDYETDVAPLLKYFCPSDRDLITEYYKNNLSIRKISKKYHLTETKANYALEQIRIKMHEIMHDEKAKKFDFMYYEKVIDNEDLPYYGDKALAKEIFNLLFGINGKEKLNTNDIIVKLNLNCNSNVVNRIVINLMLAVCKYRDGITYKKTFTFEDVYSYFMSHGNEMSPSTRNRYASYLRKISKANVKGKGSEYIPYPILTDLLIASNPQAFTIKSATKAEVETILKTYGKKLTFKTKTKLMEIFNIRERELMNGKEINHVYRLLNTLDMKRNVVRVLK